MGKVAYVVLFGLIILYGGIRIYNFYTAGERFTSKEGEKLALEIESLKEIVFKLEFKEMIRYGKEQEAWKEKRATTKRQ